jgi:hypothetical protein
LAESIDYTRRREAFGKKLIDQPVVKHKIAHMASPTASPPRTQLYCRMAWCWQCLLPHGMVLTVFIVAWHGADSVSCRMACC